jgi:hypothetical protein
LRSEDNPNPPTLPSDDAYEVLLRIRNRREPVTIRTSLRTFNNMVLKNLTIPRAPGRGDELKFTATFQQIQAVENIRSIRVSPPNATGKRKVSKTPEPLDTRMIRIDTYYHEWFDPEAPAVNNTISGDGGVASVVNRLNSEIAPTFGRWRRSAQFAKGKILNDSSTITLFAPGRWDLYRGSFSAFGEQPQQPSVNAATAIRGIHRRNIILVSINDCNLHGFTINEPSSSTQVSLTLKHRRT